MNESAKKPVDYDQLFPGRFLKAGLLLGKQVTLTIAAIDTVSLPQNNGQLRIRGIITFERTDKQLVLNSTNGQCLKAMFGKEVQKWVGHAVTFAPEQDRFGSEMVDAIRIAGSPELKSAITVTINMPCHKPKQRTLAHTGKPAENSDKTAAPAQREPGDD